jgi:hypothetical protein
VVSFTLRLFYSWGRNPGIHWIGGCVGLRDGLDAVAKRKIPSPCRESNPDRPARSLVAMSLNYSSFSLNSAISEISWHLLRLNMCDIWIQNKSPLRFKTRKIYLVRIGPFIWRRWEGNIGMDLRNRMRRCGLDSSGSG